MRCAVVWRAYPGTIVASRHLGDRTSDARVGSARRFGPVQKPQPSTNFVRRTASDHRDRLEPPIRSADLISMAPPQGDAPPTPSRAPRSATEPPATLDPPCDSDYGDRCCNRPSDRRMTMFRLGRREIGLVTLTALVCFGVAIPLTGAAAGHGRGTVTDPLVGQGQRCVVLDLDTGRGDPGGEWPFRRGILPRR